MNQWGSTGRVGEPYVTHRRDLWGNFEAEPQVVIEDGANCIRLSRSVVGVKRLTNSKLPPIASYPLSGDCRRAWLYKPIKA